MPHDQPSDTQPGQRLRNASSIIQVPATEDAPRLLFSQLPARPFIYATVL